MFEQDNHNEKWQLKEINIIEMEAAVLGAILQNHKKSDLIFARLNSDDFSNPFHISLFNIFKNFFQKNHKIDLLTIIDYISTHQGLFDEYTNVIETIEILALEDYYSGNIENYIKNIKAFSIKRKINKYGKVLQEINIDSTDLKDKLYQIEKELIDIASSVKSEGILDLDTIIQMYFAKIEQILNLSSYSYGILTGFESLDRITNGFNNGDLIIIAARPGMGKTTFALNIIVNLANFLLSEFNVKLSDEKDKLTIQKEEVGSILFFSLEMSNFQIVQKIFNMYLQINLDYNNVVKWNKRDFEKILTNALKIQGLPIYIDESPNITLIEIQAKIKEFSNTQKVKLVVIDYLQLLKIQKNVPVSYNRQQEVSEISRTLKVIAKQFNIPIIALAQLSRKIEERKGENKKPILSDLRESGSIEQDADVVCFIYPNNDNIHSEDDVLSDYVNITIAKNRNGATGEVVLKFIKAFSRFETT